MNPLIPNRNSKIPHFQFPHFLEFSFVNHGIFSRIGGVSAPPNEALNVSLNTGDSIHHVLENRRRIHSCVGGKDLVFMNQVHGDHILVLEDYASTSSDLPGPYGTGDAIITREQGRNIVVQVADCQPVLLLDPVQKVVAGVHSGWRGSVLNIAGKTVAFMREKFNCNPADIKAGIGPSLGPCCSEFLNYQQEIPEFLWKYKDPKTENFDFWSLTIDQLTQEGVSGKNIHGSGICTKCHSEQFFSYRKHRQTGRLAAVIGLI
ncbi:MAG: peptidoglycan editing factor PgeF [Proteobacteria bacterium]|nr:peptidoglycan editing factor PgeF [Pseudomonadota bacterium]